MMHMSSRCHLIGIASYGVECSNTVNPGVYTKVAQYFDWIKLITKNRINFGLQSNDTTEEFPFRLKF